ncbi:unnamed protein product [Arctia plantaginis]|uniref:Uncharacterized protein n=1 Tax=Arctia plantaginis TaxID=874455 RepID=A0A8S0Z1V3_ARCPL|nr:unnamed protein product [Arctia plantaginis]CAB3254110.1 unnamed protein product [Arctia plantaginis]
MHALKRAVSVRRVRGGRHKALSRTDAMRCGATVLRGAAVARGGVRAELRTESFGKFLTETEDAARDFPRPSTDEHGARLSHLDAKLTP